MFPAPDNPDEEAAQILLTKLYHRSIKERRPTMIPLITAKPIDFAMLQVSQGDPIIVDTYDPLMRQAPESHCEATVQHIFRGDDGQVHLVASGSLDGQPFEYVIRLQDKMRQD